MGLHRITHYVKTFVMAQQMARYIKRLNNGSELPVVQTLAVVRDSDVEGQKAFRLILDFWPGVGHWEVDMFDARVSGAIEGYALRASGGQVDRWDLEVLPELPEVGQEVLIIQPHHELRATLRQESQPIGGTYQVTAFGRTSEPIPHAQPLPLDVLSALADDVPPREVLTREEKNRQLSDLNK